jgi:hypothetical protein
MRVFASFCKKKGFLSFFEKTSQKIFIPEGRRVSLPPRRGLALLSRARENAGQRQC